MDRFTDLGQRVRTHICYAHIFGDALDDRELVARCSPGEPDGVASELRRLEAAGAIERVEGRWFLKGEAIRGLAELHRGGSWAAERTLADHRLLLTLLERLPVVRLLAISGSVAWRNRGRANGKGPDLDLFVITAPGGVHLVRLLLRAWGVVQRWAGRFGRRRAPICANYVTDGSFLDITNPSFYTASDALHVRVLKGTEEYRRFIRANSWIGRYYPVDAPAPNGAAPPRGSALLSAVNFVCFVIMGASSWVKLRIDSWRRAEPMRGFQYSLAFTVRTNVSLVRCAPAGGGHQPTVARRFHEVYTRHFGSDEDLQRFLFPGTTGGGVFTANGYAESGMLERLGYTT